MSEAEAERMGFLAAHGKNWYRNHNLFLPYVNRHGDAFHWGFNVYALQVPTLVDTLATIVRKAA